MDFISSDAGSSPTYGGPQLSRQKKIPHGKTKAICFCCEVFGFAVRYFVFAVRFLVLPCNVFVFAVRFLVSP